MTAVANKDLSESWDAYKELNRTNAKYYIDLVAKDCSDDSITNLVLPNIVQLDLRDVDDPEEKFARIALLFPNVQRLTVGNCDEIRSFKDLTGLKQLQTLNITKSEVVHSFFFLQFFAHLSNIHISDCEEVRDFRSFQVIKRPITITIQNCKELRLYIMPTLIPSLQNLFILRCQEIRNIASHIVRKTDLKGHIDQAGEKQIPCSIDLDSLNIEHDLVEPSAATDITMEHNYSDFLDPVNDAQPDSDDDAGMS